MSLRTEGFEADTAALTASGITLSGTVTISTTIVHQNASGFGGDQSVKLDGGSAAMRIPATGVAAAEEVAFALYSAAPNGNVDVRFDTGGSENCSINRREDGYLRIYRGSTLLATSAVPLANATWYWVLCKVTATEAGRVEVLVNGSSFVDTGAGVDCRATSTDHFDSVYFSIDAPTSVAVHVDDYHQGPTGTLTNEVWFIDTAGTSAVSDTDAARFAGVAAEASGTSDANLARVAYVFAEASVPYYDRAKAAYVLAEVSTMPTLYVDVEGPITCLATIGPAVRVEQLPAAAGSGRIEAALTHWSVRQGVTPYEARQPWAKVGNGGTLTAKGIRITGGSAHGYRRVGYTQRERAHLEIQVGTFQGATSAPLWPSGVSGHVMAIDDGTRTLGVAIGDELVLVHPETGAVLWTPPEQPGGWTTARSYRLLKDATTCWELYVDDRLVCRVPYHVAATTIAGAVAFAWGWADATPGATGTATWEDVETAIDTVLAPTGKVTRQRMSMPAALQAAWTPRHEALLRGIVGVSHSAADAMTRVSRDSTAAVLVVTDASIVGDELPAAVGWTTTGGAWSVVRDRIRIAANTSPAYAWVDFTAPEHPELAVWRLRATFTVRSTAPDAFGRVGPYLQLRDGAHAIGAVMVRDLSNHDAYSWILTDSEPSTALTVLGDTALPVSGYGSHEVELHVVERDRVLLFVDGELVEELPYARFAAATTDYQARVGRDGSATLAAVVDLERVYAAQAYGDNGYRPQYLRRVAERLLFASGCEKNTRLDVWLRRRWAAFTARGTDRVLSEVRRLACDDDAERIIERVPAAWYLGVTYPGVTPTFIDYDGSLLANSTIELTPHAPNFTTARLAALISRYLLPHSTIEATHQVALRTTLETDASPGGGGSTFEVTDGTGFAAEDAVTLRKTTTGTLLTVEYTGTADTMEVAVTRGRVWSTWTAASAGLAATIDSARSVVGLDADRLAAITPGNRVGVVGAGVDVDVHVDVIGVLSGTAQRERLVASGLVQRDGVSTWTTVHGAVCTPAAQDDIDIVDQGTGTVLYTIASGQRATGVHLFDAPLLVGPSVLTLTADAACTDPIVVAGVEEAAGYALEDVALTGTTPVATATAYSSLRAIGAGYLAAARTVVLEGRLTDPDTATLRVVSTSASDVQRMRLVVLDTSLTGRVLELVLTGTTPVVVDLSFRLHRVAAVWLSSAAVGTITVRTDADATLVARLVATETQVGLDERQIAVTGPIRVVADIEPNSPTYAVAIGLNADNELAAEAVQVSTTEQATTLTDWSLFFGLALGHVSGTITVTASGLGWSHDSWEQAVAHVSHTSGWTASGPTGDPLAWDGTLAEAALADAMAGPLTLTGTWSTTEDTTLLSMTESAGTWTAVTELLTDTFLTGAVLRRVE